MLSFEEYLHQSSLVRSTDELFKVFLGALSSYGFDKVLFGLITDHADLTVSAGIGVMHNYPEDWMKYYFEKGFDKIDPIVTYGVHQSGAFKWSEIEDKIDLYPKQKKCLELGNEAGLYHGISIPLKGPHNQMAGISLASSQVSDSCYFNADLMTAFCNHFYLVYKRLNRKEGHHRPNIVLTNKEQEVLTWAANGKSDEEIGEILHMSKHTVNMHFRHIYTKMGANNRILAVVKALSIGLVHI